MIQRTISYSSQIEAVDPLFTNEMNQTLMACFILDEIYDVVRQMHPTKALGPKSMPAVLFQKFC